MKNKLTLDIEESIIEKAKAFSKDKGINLSEMVENYLEFITQYNEEKEIVNKHKEISTVKELAALNDKGNDLKPDIEKREIKKYTWQKFTLAIVFFGMATIAFMMKLPSAFSNYDKKLHALFYFLTAAFLNILFVKWNLLKHLAVFIFLALFGVAIEYAQEYSNQFFHKRLHGRHDIEDIKYNLYGLLIFSIVWISFAIIVFGYRKINRQSEKLNT